jgi:uncharacterized protein (DUF302 family)
MWRGLKLVAGSLLAVAAIAHADNNPGPYVIYETKGKYADVLDELNQAITNRGLVVGTTSHVQEMLSRTGKDLGGRRPLYDNGDVLQFCSAVLSRKAMEADPRNIIFCPYGIAVWTEAGKAERVFVGYRRTEAPGSPQSAAALKEVEKLLDDIVREAIGR